MKKFLPIFLLLWGLPSLVGDQAVFPFGYDTKPGEEWKIDPFYDGARYQQLYEAAEFQKLSTVPVFITGISFRTDEDWTVGASMTAEFDVRASITTKSVTSLSMVMDANAGPNEVMVLPRGSRTFTTSPGPVPIKPFEINILFETSYQYDPNFQNLLIEIRSYNTDRKLGDTDVARVGMGSVLAPLSSQIGEVSFAGFVTQFSFTPVPEPTLRTFLLVGLSAEIFLHRRKRCRL